MKRKMVVAILLSAMVLSALPVNTLSVSAIAYSASEAVSEATATFTFTDDGVTSSSESDSYKIEGTRLTIKESGTYILTGSCEEGSVTVKKGTTGVTLILQNLSLTSTEGAPITINKENTNSGIIILGTNTITDNEDPDDEVSSDEAVADLYEGAAIKIKSGGDLTITGNGTLNIYGNAKNGIKAGDGSTINVGASSSDSFTLNVKAANDGISGDGSEETAGVNIIGGTINVDAADDGIKSDYTLNIGAKGSTAGATINVTNSYEGFEGATVNLYGGSGKIVSSDDGINAANSDLTGYSYALNIYGGSWDVNAGGDGLDSNGTLLVSGGETVVSSSTSNDDNAIDWGDNSTATYTGGTIIGIGMGNMQEGFTTGNYVIFGQSGGFGGMGGPGGFGNTQNTQNQGGFGGPGGQGNNGIFGNEGAPGNTGNAGGTGAPGAFGNTENQSSLSLKAGDVLTITDSESGVTIYKTTVKKAANSVIFAGADLVSGKSYTLLVNGEEAATATVGENGNTQPDNSNQNTNTEVYVLYNPNTGEHFYTNDTDEVKSVTAAGWENQGASFTASDERDGAAVYRLYNPNAGDHFYTTSVAEKNFLEKAGWKNEGIRFYVKSTGTSAVYRVYNENAPAWNHYFTRNYSEYQDLINKGWKDEGIAWYAVTIHS